jgi:hypothetical protein
MLDARLHLLDRQLLDADGTPVGIVDDLDVEGVDAGVDIAAGAAPGQVTGIFTGRVLMTRLLGGKQPPAHLQTLPWRLVAKIGTTVRLTDHEVVIDALWVEKWLADNVIGRIPGGLRAAE